MVESCLGVALLSVVALVAVPDVGVNLLVLTGVFGDCVVVGLIDSFFVLVLEIVDVLVTVEKPVELLNSFSDSVLDVDKIFVGSVLEVEDGTVSFVVILVEVSFSLKVLTVVAVTSVEEIVGLDLIDEPVVVHVVVPSFVT